MQIDKPYKLCKFVLPNVAKDNEDDKFLELVNKQVITIFYRFTENMLWNDNSLPLQLTALSFPSPKSPLQRLKQHNGREQDGGQEQKKCA